MPLLRLHHELYSKRAIEATAEVYAAVAQVTTVDALPYYEVALEASEVPDTELLGEFQNYALALTVEERRGT